LIKENYVKIISSEALHFPSQRLKEKKKRLWECVSGDLPKECQLVLKEMEREMEININSKINSKRRKGWRKDHKMER